MTERGLRIAGIGLCLLVLGVALGATGSKPAPAAAQLPVFDVLLVGDSIGVGAKPFVEEMLATRRLTFDERHGRNTAQGMKAMRMALRTVAPDTVVMNLGTNDGGDPLVFAGRVRRVLATVPLNACVVWATIHRPPRKGPFRELNRALRREAISDSRLVLVHWDLAVDDGAVLLPDLVHPDVAGDRYMAAMIASAVRRGCDPAG